MANEQGQNGRGEYQIDDLTYAKGGLLLIVESREHWTLKLKLWTSQIRTLIDNFVIVLVCAKWSKLITLEENIVSVQQVPLRLPLFFAFSSEVLNSGVYKAVLTKFYFKMQLVKNVLVYVFGVFTFNFCCWVFIHKIIQVSRFLLFICISYPLKVFKFDTGILCDSCAVPLL